MNQHDLVYLAKTIYGEARSEKFAGMKAVGWVVRNRAERGGWWGNSIMEVCLKPWQFSCWNPDDPNRIVVERASLKNATFLVCLQAAIDVLLDAPDADPTHGSTHYHADYVAPAWADGKEPAAKIGRHLFYNNID